MWGLGAEPMWTAELQNQTEEVSSLARLEAPPD